MPTRNFFRPEEIIDLIQEKGDIIYFCKLVRQQSRNSDYGIPAQRGKTCKRVAGYAAEQNWKQIATSAGPTATGGYIAYICAEVPERLRGSTGYQPLSEAEISSDAFLVIDNRTYQIETQGPAVYQGGIMLHVLKMVETTKQEYADNLDDVTDFPA